MSLTMARMVPTCCASAGSPIRHPRWMSYHCARYFRICSGRIFSPFIGGYGRRWVRNSRSGIVLPQAAHDERPDGIGHRQWQALPGGDEQRVFRVQRVVVGHRLTWLQSEAVMQLRRLETPVVLESVGAGADLGAAEVE